MSEPASSIRTYRDAVAIVTGGASGIGRAMCEELVRRGAEVVVADRQAEAAARAAAALRDAGGRATAAPVDVTDFPAMEAIILDTVGRAGRLDYLFNNAGIAVGGYVHQFGADDWNAILDVNVRGVVNGVQAAYRTMVAQGYGHIVNTASMAGLMPWAGGVAYSMTKHAVVGLSLSLRVEAARFGLRVSVLCPGVVRTDILEGGGRFGRVLDDTPPEILRRRWETYKPIPPARFAAKALDSVALNRAVIIEPAWWKVIWWINRLSPGLGGVLAAKRYREDLRESEAGRNAGQPR